MRNLTEIGILLSHIRLNLIRHVRGTGLAVDDPEFAREIDELDRMKDRLAILIRDLQSAQHATDAREQNLWKIPPGIKIRFHLLCLESAERDQRTNP